MTDRTGQSDGLKKGHLLNIALTKNLNLIKINERLTITEINNIASMFFAKYYGISGGLTKWNLTSETKCNYFDKRNVSLGIAPDQSIASMAADV